MTDLPLDPQLAQRYATGQLSTAEAVQVEQAMDRSGQWRALVGTHVPAERLDLNFMAIAVELDAPKRGRVERVMVRLGLDEHVARLMAATPVLRRSWYLASFLVLFFGLAAAGTENTGSIGFFLAVAPIVPVLGVALAYGPAVDPAHDMTVATPVSGFRLLLLRSVAVLATSVVFGGVAAVIVAPDHGLEVLAWMLPALALTAATLALATVVPTRSAAGVTIGVWLVVVTIVGQAATDLTLFGGIAQPIYLALAVIAGIVVVMRREVFEVAGVGA
ncbi:MAG: zf-HC2 domain-containing protein [Actinomycetota bacterium]